MTIKDIAKLADVSVSTVSRVLNDRPDVSEDSRRRVRAVIEAHRYVPNNSARDLVKIRSDAVGLVVRGVQNLSTPTSSTPSSKSSTPRATRWSCARSHRATTRFSAVR